MQSYTWVFGEPRETLLVQSENRGLLPPAPHAASTPAATSDGAVVAAPLLAPDGEATAGPLLFSTQLRLSRDPAPLTLARAAFLLLIAFPLLTHRIQWYIHVEALRVWWKGGQLYPHPLGSTNAFTRTVEAMFTPLALTVAFVQWLARVLGLSHAVPTTVAGDAAVQSFSAATSS